MPRFPRILALCLALLGAPAAHATAQIPDALILDGKEFRLNTNPLEAELERRKWQPPKEASISSANWRGHVAVWEVKGDRLFLKDVTIRVRRPAPSAEPLEKSILGELYPGVAEVHADWYSGALIIPDGKMTEYVHMGYGSSYDHYQVLRVRAGQVVERLSLSGAEFAAYKERKFAEFMQTDAFKRAFADIRKEGDGLEEGQALDFMKSFFAEQYLSQ